jgi:hypothetical protein
MNTAYGKGRHDENVTRCDDYKSDLPIAGRDSIAYRD